MIHNPKIPAYQYNPYSHEFTIEKYGFEMLLSNRQKAIEIARKSERIGLILGTLGRQGNIKIFEVIYGITKYLYKEKKGGRGEAFNEIIIFVEEKGKRNFDTFFE